MGRPCECDEQTLTRVISRKQARLVTKPHTYSKRSRVKFQCGCGQVDEQNIGRIMHDHGALCKRCRTSDKRSKNEKHIDMRAIVQSILAL